MLPDHSMLVEHLTVSFKPSSFFKANPSMDVPGIKDLLSISAFGGSHSTIHGEASCHRYLSPGPNLCKCHMYSDRMIIVNYLEILQDRPLDTA